jgi:Tol biopolymer transport system component
MRLDGSEPRELVSSGSRLRYPTYSPDGRYIAYLATPSENYYDRAIYFADLTSGDRYIFDVNLIIGGTALEVSVVPNGPLSWTP